MVRTISIAVVVVLAVAAHVNAQWFNFAQSGAGMGSMQGAGGQSANIWSNLGNMNRPQRPVPELPRDNNEYLTCTGRNTDDDDLRVTFTMENNNDPMARMWGRQGNLKINAHVSLSRKSTLQGQVELVVTTGSRSEEVCLSRALGEILDVRSFWDRSPKPSGVVSSPIHIRPGHAATVSEHVTTLTFRQLVGRGMALCPSNQIRGTTCVDVIPLCCKIGYDSQPATTPFTMPGQIFGRAGAASDSQFSQDIFGAQSSIGQFDQAPLSGQTQQGSFGQFQQGPPSSPFQTAPASGPFQSGPSSGQFQPGMVDQGMQFGMQSNNNGPMMADQGFGGMNQDQGFAPQNQGFSQQGPAFNQQGPAFNPQGQGFASQGQGFAPQAQGFGPQGQGAPQMDMGIPPMNGPGPAINNGPPNSGMMNDVNGQFQPNNGAQQPLAF